VPRRSIGFPLTVGIVLVVLVLALAVGWQILVVSDARGVARGLTNLDWLLLVLGAVFFLLVIVGLVWLCAWLVREMRLNQSQRAFLDAVTHEMKTPLASLRLYLDTIARHDPDAHRRREFLGNMRNDVERLDHTVEQVLAAARAEEPGRRAERRAVRLADVLDESIARIQSQHRLPDGAISIDPGPDTKVYGDASELGVVFRNLLENAVKYSHDPVEVRVRVRPAGEGRVQVEISDRGIGIPAGELRKIFQRFYRAGRDVRRTAAGLGLGLFIVRSLVRRQGGRVEARSEGHGAGSRFVVTLRSAGRPAERGEAHTTVDARTGAARVGA
jgi:signal transduction histidine kinase